MSGRLPLHNDGLPRDLLPYGNTGALQPQLSARRQLRQRTEADRMGVGQRADGVDWEEMRGRLLPREVDLPSARGVRPLLSRVPSECVVSGLDWTLDTGHWTRLDWTGLDWIGLDWTGLDWIGLDSDCGLRKQKREEKGGGGEENYTNTNIQIYYYIQ